MEDIIFEINKNLEKYTTLLTHYKWGKNNSLIIKNNFRSYNI